SRSPVPPFQLSAFQRFSFSVLPPPPILKGMCNPAQGRPVAGQRGDGPTLGSLVRTTSTRKVVAANRRHRCYESQDPKPYDLPAMVVEAVYLAFVIGNLVLITAFRFRVPAFSFSAFQLFSSYPVVPCSSNPLSAFCFLLSAFRRLPKAIPLPLAEPSLTLRAHANRSWRSELSAGGWLSGRLGVGPGQFLGLVLGEKAAEGGEEGTATPAGKAVAASRVFGD